MKQVTLLFSLLLINTMSYTKIGRHNFQINIGGGYQQFFTPSESCYVNNTFINLPSFYTIGGVATLELGYLFHSVRDNNVVHGFDFRTHITISFLSSLDTYSDKIYGGFDIAYTIGHQFSWGRFMYDFMGIGISPGITTSNYNNNFFDLEVSNFSLVINILGPGVQFLFNNGFTVGLRNKFKIDVGNYRLSGLFGWETAVTFGFTIGGGKKPRPPWEIYYDKKIEELKSIILEQAKEIQKAKETPTVIKRPFILN